MPDDADEQDGETWRQKMVRMLSMIGQLKRKAKFDTNSEFMKPRSSSKQKVAQDAISEPNGGGSLN